MKKLLILLPVLFIVTLVFSSNLSFFNYTKMVRKEISLSIFTKSDYSSAAYDNAQAIVEVTVSKKDENKTIVIDKKTYKAMQLKQFPAANNAIAKKLFVAGTFSGHEVLIITYTITYNSNDSIIKFENSGMKDKQTSEDNINISI